MKLNVADAGQSNFGGSDATPALLGNKSTTTAAAAASRRRTALFYDSESSTNNDGAKATTAAGDRTDSTTLATSDDILPPVSTLFADREAQSCDMAEANIFSDQTSPTTTKTITKQTFVPQTDGAQVAASKTTVRKRPAPTPRKRPRVRKPSKRNRAKCAQNVQQQQQQQNGLLIMQKLLGSMTSLLRRDVTPLMTSFPVVTCPQSLPLSMFCAGAIARQMPCGLLARPNLLTPAGAASPLMAGGVRGPMVRPVVWPSMLTGAGTVPAPGRRAPITANASTSAPLLAGSSRSGRQKTPEEPRSGAQNVSRLELMTVAALRDECRRCRLPTGGPKPNLVRRLQQSNFDMSFSCANTSSYVAASQSSTSIAPVQTSPIAPPPVVSSSTSKSTSTLATTPTTTTSLNEARASLSQSQAIVARILRIRAAQRARNAELAAGLATTSSAGCTTSPAVPPATAGTPVRAPALEVPRTVCVSSAIVLPQLNAAANLERSSTLTGNIMSCDNRMNCTPSISNMMALTAYRQQQQLLNQNAGRTSQGNEEVWRQNETNQALLVRQQQDLGQQGQGQQVKSHENLLWASRDAESQVTLCRQQQMLIHELRRQLEQSRRALIEAQAGEPPPPHRLVRTTQPFVDLCTLQKTPDNSPRMPQIPNGACSGPGTESYCIYYFSVENLFYY